MRYVPTLITQSVIQVPENNNSYINVRGVGARGLGEKEFDGLISSVGDNNVIVTSLTDQDGGTLTQYEKDLVPGVQVCAFIYSLSPPPLEANTLLSVSNVITEAVDFSSSPSTSPSLQPLTYYIWGYDVNTGVIGRGIVTTVGNKVLNPDFWGDDNYVELRFSRENNNVIPIIYRKWGTQTTFLGVIGNGKIGFPGASTTSFKDLGLLEIPSWDGGVETPYFLKDFFSINSGIPTLNRSLIGKELFEIPPRSEGPITNLELKEPPSITIDFSKYSAGNRIKFVIDDTKYIQTAIELAQSSSIKELFFPSGTYYLRDTQLVNSSSKNYSNLVFKGVGVSSKIKRVPSLIPLSGNPGLFSFSGVANSPLSGIKFTNISLDGNFQSNFSIQSANEPLVKITNCSDVFVIGSKFENSGGEGLFIENGNNILLSNSVFSKIGRRYESGKAPLYISTSESIVAQGNIFEFSTSGPTIFSTDFSTINSNIIRSCGDRGISTEGSYLWNAGNNLAYSDNGSLIQSIDQYNSEFFGSTLEVTKGIPLSPTYFTVTDGGESVGIVKNSIDAKIYNIDQFGDFIVSPIFGNFRVVETTDQLDVGIFSVTLPGTTTTTVGGKIVPATSTFLTLNPQEGRYGYFYQITASVLIGRGGRGFSPFSISKVSISGQTKVLINLRNSSDLLGFQIYSALSPENDQILIRNFSNTELGGWDQDTGYLVEGIDIDSNSLILGNIPALSSVAIGDPPIEFVGGELFILRSNYLISRGNIIVH